MKKLMILIFACCMMITGCKEETTNNKEEIATVQREKEETPSVVEEKEETTIQDCVEFSVYKKFRDSLLIKHENKSDKEIRNVYSKVKLFNKGTNVYEW